MLRCLFAVLLSGVMLAGPELQAGDGIRQMTTFGDSLTANDILWLVYNQPREVYGVDPFELTFRKARRPGDRLVNLGFPGSPVDAVRSQIALYRFLRLAGVLPESELLSWQGGANDLFDEIPRLIAVAPGVDPAADAVVDDLIADIQESLADLQAIDPQARLIVWTIPDIGRTPRYVQQWSSEEAENFRQHTERVNAAIRGLAGAKILVIDVYAISQSQIDDPPVIAGVTLLGPPVFGVRQALFADPIHPSGISNALLANMMIDAMNRRWDEQIPLYSERELARIVVGADRRGD